MQRASWTPQELRETMMSLLNDREMLAKMHEISNAMQKGNGPRDAATAILKTTSN